MPHIHEITTMPTYHMCVSLLVLMLTACVPVPTQTDVAHNGMDSHARKKSDVFVVLPISKTKMHSPDALLINCIRSKLKNNPQLNQFMVDSHAFQDALFPWFERDKAPDTQEDLNTLLTKAYVKGKLDELGIRYLVYINSHHITKAKADWLTGGGGYGGAFVIGYKSSKHVTGAKLVIWDISNLNNSEQISTKTTGKSGVVGAGILPIFFSANTQRGACNAITDQLVRIFTDKPSDKVE